MLGFWEIVGGVVMILVSLGILLSVVLQESPKGGGISGLTGGESYYNKNQGRTLDAMLGKTTKILAIVFFVVTIAVYVIERVFYMASMSL